MIPIIRNLFVFLLMEKCKTIASCRAVHGFGWLIIGQSINQSEPTVSKKKKIYPNQLTLPIFQNHYLPDHCGSDNGWQPTLTVAIWFG